MKKGTVLAVPFFLSWGSDPGGQCRAPDDGHGLRPLAYWFNGIPGAGE